MRGSKRSPTAPKRPEAGFSFIEILVALVLFSALGLVLWSGLGSGQALVRKTSQRATYALKILQLDNGLRQALGRLRVPFWVPAEAAVRQERGRLVMSWLDGDPDKTLTLQLRGDRIRIGEAGAEGFFGPFPGARLGLFRDEEGRPLGVEVTIAGGGEPTRILARFGSTPL